MHLLNERQVSQQLRVTVPCPRRWRHERRELPFVKVGRLVRYRQPDVDRFVQSKLVQIGEGNPEVKAKGTKLNFQFASGNQKLSPSVRTMTFTNVKELIGPKHTTDQQSRV